MAERIGPDGKAITELTDEEIAKVVDGVGQLDGVESIAVCLLFSFLNASHETKLKAALQARYPEIYVSAFSEVQPEFREYERFSTALINAFLQPEVARYMYRLRDAIGELAPNAKLGISATKAALGDLEAQANAWINDATDAVKSVQLDMRYDMRYIGQNYELSIPIYRGSGAAVLPDDASLSERFFAEHERAYGHVDRAAPIELVNLRIRASASLSRTRIKTQSPEGTPTPVATQEAWFQEDAPHQTGIYERADLPVGTRLEGPVIITQLDATTVVPPGATVSVDTALNLIVEIENV